jgi:hypothetical protein
MRKGIRNFPRPPSTEAGVAIPAIMMQKFAGCGFGEKRPLEPSVGATFGVVNVVGGSIDKARKRRARANLRLYHGSEVRGTATTVVFARHVEVIGTTPLNLFLVAIEGVAARRGETEGGRTLGERRIASKNANNDSSQ